MRWMSVIGLAALAAATSQAALVENFDDVSSLPGKGWVFTNNSDEPGDTWIQGNPDWEITAYSGDPTSYLYVDYLSTDSNFVATISNWAITPAMTLDANSTISFYTKTVDPVFWPDRLQVRLSTNGSSTNVGTAATDVGDFTNLLLDINPTYSFIDYPTTWTKYDISLSSLSGEVTGRIALRYFVENAGSSGDNSYTVGIDDFTVVPEPSAAVAMLGLSALGLTRRRK